MQNQQIMIQTITTMEKMLHNYDRGGGDQYVDIHHGHDCGQECCDEEEEHHIRGSLIRVFEPFLSTLGQYPNDSIPAPYKTTLTQPPIDEAKGNIESSDNKDG